MNTPYTLDINKTVLILIDFQERLFPVMHDKEKLLRNLLKLVRGARVLGIPIVLTEQYPRGLGITLPEVKNLLPDVKPIEKVCFSCCDEASFCQAVESLGRRQVLIAGIEAHICVYQTAMALSHSGYQVQVVGDCVSSRDPENKLVALFKMGAAGISPTTTEMALFELLKVASGDKFKQISNIVKSL
ncbi:MAG: hydrolase [Chloroflexi bacterium RBG_16_56_11]|nr:MAG: hydrolase [Chloroflexi bacterium RBG_16_56_11]